VNQLKDLGWERQTKNDKSDICCQFPEGISKVAFNLRQECKYKQKLKNKTERAHGSFLNPPDPRKRPSS